MPNEGENLNYIRGYARGMQILAGEPLDDKNRSPFSEEELQNFDTRFESIFGWMNRQGYAPVVGKEHYEQILWLAEIQKKIFGDAKFVGDGVGGWGMRDIVPEDVYGDSNPGTGLGATGFDDTWEKASGVAGDANWTVGAIATRFSRNDMGWTTRNTATFQAGASMVTQDVNQDKWAVAYFGMADLSGRGLVQGHVVAFSNKERDWFEFTNQMQLCDMLYAPLGRVIYFNHNVPYKSGHIVRPAAAAVAAPLPNVAAVRPIGVTFVSQRRALQLATLFKPAQA